MIGYLCATPYHIMAAVTMASDMFAEEDSTLIVLDHFNIDETLIEKIRKTGIFTDVLLFKSNNKSLMNKAKRFYNAFVPHPLMRSLAKRKDFTHFFCFALDFINISYLIQSFRKNGANCQFSFAEDGIGSYINESLYHPNKLASLLIQLNGRANALEAIQSLYIYKPEYAVVNKEFELVKIKQSPKTYETLRCFVSEIWPFEEEVDFKDSIVYFEQPKENPEENKDVTTEQNAIRKAEELLGAHAFVKLHPRSYENESWANFDTLKTRIPFEAIFLQTDFQPKLFLTDNSTAVFSPYMLDGDAELHCKTIFLNRLVHGDGANAYTDTIDAVSAHINQKWQATLMESPASQEALEAILKNM